MRRLICSALLVAALLIPAAARSADNGDGTFTNPVLWTDMPDPDVTRVGDTFYFVSTSMHMLPGVTILESRDLVNWSFAANVVPSFGDDPFWNLQGGNRYAKGQWATALRYWGGEFHVLFTSNSDGTFIYSSPTMDGQWRRTVVYDGPYHPILDRLDPLKEQDCGDGFCHHTLYDPGFLVDDDGRVYVVHGNSVIYITELDPVSLQPLGRARVLYRPHRNGLEGNRPYHIGEYYYVICTYGGSHSGNVTCLRSRSLDGPWEEREVMCGGARMADSHILQACLIPLENGETWSMAFLDMGALGRIPHLLPVHWADGWPLPGGWADGNLTLPKPVPGVEPQAPATSDDFSAGTLGLQWQFNHNPDPGKFSLSERPGCLRLHATAPDFGGTVSEGSLGISSYSPLLMARNTLTQRLFGPYSTITVKVDASRLKNGDRAGLALLNIPYAGLAVAREGRAFSLLRFDGDRESEHVEAAAPLTAGQAGTLWLRIDVDGLYGLADFSYSLDGAAFLPLGGTFRMKYDGGYFVGNRPALFCYNASREGGFVDIDDFTVETRPLFDRNIAAGSTLQAEWTDALWRTECRWSANGEDNMDVAWTGDGGLIRFDRLSFSAGISKVVFTLRNVAGVNTFVELSDSETSEVLGRVPVGEPSAGYREVVMSPDKPLTDVSGITVRIWNGDWDVPAMGEVLLDKISFKAGEDVPPAQENRGPYSSIRPGEVWLDTAGKPIQAHGFQVLEKDGTYYWYGENKEKTVLGSHVWTWGIRCYKSEDFYNWEDCGLIIPPDTTDFLSPLHYTQSLDRPHIIHCEKTGKYVCWIKSMDEDGYFVILQADDMLGPYEYVRSLRPEGYGVGDFDLYADPVTGKACVWFERPHWELICADLTDDYTDVTPVYSSHFAGLRPPYTREAPTHFVYEGRHYLFTSGTTGYYPNVSMIAAFDDLHGEYEDLGNPHPSDPYNHSFGSQITDVVKIPGKRDLYVAVADRWMPQITNTEEPAREAARMVVKYKDHKPFEPDFSMPGVKDKRDEVRTGWDVTCNATYVFLPVVFKDGVPRIEWLDEWRLEDYE